MGTKYPNGEEIFNSDGTFNPPGLNNRKLELDGLYWLVEYVGARPVPVYAQESGSSYVCDAWLAKKFKTKGEAEAWMNRDSIAPFTEPWTATQHGFGVGRNVE